MGQFVVADRLAHLAYMLFDININLPLCGGVRRYRVSAPFGL